jgi:hypothetical protein
MSSVLKAMGSGTGQDKAAAVNRIAGTTIATVERVALRCVFPTSQTIHGQVQIAASTECRVSQPCV